MPNPFFADLVRELCQEGGTGPLTPTRAAPGNRRFADAVPVGAAFHYAVTGAAWPAEWETGTGHIDDDGRLVRETVTASSNGGTHVDFAPGLKTISLTAGAAWFAEQQAAVAALGDVAGEVADLADGLADKQPLSTGHAGAAYGAEGDTLTVRRGEGWVNIPLSALAYRDATGRLRTGAPLACVDGTAGAPPITFAADPDTGLYRPGDNLLGFVTNGQERVRITSSGAFLIGDNVGYGMLSVRPAANKYFNVVEAAHSTLTNLAAGITFSRGSDSAQLAAIFGCRSGGLALAGREGIALCTGGGATYSGTIERLTIASNGDVGLSAVTVTPISGRTVQISDASQNGTLSIVGPSGTVYLATSGANALLAARQGMSLQLHSDNVLRLQIAATGGHLLFGSDGTQNLGGASNRGNTAYFASGAINTSDGREKTEIRPLTATELRAGKRIAGAIGIFRFLAAIAEKGAENAREHVGVIAQDVWAIMADEGLIDPLDEAANPSSKYAFLCWDGWDAQQDEDGAPVRAAGDRFGIRPDQLALFLIAVQEQRLSVLEAAA